MANSERQKVLIASHLFLEKDGKTLLARRFNTGYEDGKYSVVAGHVDVGESTMQAMIREAQEEAGIIIEPEQLDLCHVMHRKSDVLRVDFFFRATEWERAPRIMEPDKCDDLRWFEKSELPENMVAYVKWAMERVEKGQVYSEFGWEDGMIQESLFMGKSDS